MKLKYARKLALAAMLCTTIVLPTQATVVKQAPVCDPGAALQNCVTAGVKRLDQEAPPTPGNTVPEPGTISLVLVLLVGLAFLQKTQKPRQRQ